MQETHTEKGDIFPGGPRPLVSRATLARSLAPAYSSLPSTRWTTNRNRFTSSIVTATALLSLPDAKPSYFNTPLEGLVTGRPSTGLPINILKSNTIEGAPSVGGHTGGGQRHWRPKKNDRDGSTLTAGNCLHVHNFQAVDSRQNLDAKQSNYSYTCTSTCIPRITCACTWASRSI